MKLLTDKISVRIFTFCVCLSVLMFSACTNDDVFDGPAGEVDFTEFGVEYNKEGSLILVSDVITGFYDLANLSSASIGFTVDAFGESVSGVDLFVSQGGQSTQLASISSFPSQQTHTLESVLASTGISASSLAPGDEFVFSFRNVATSAGTYSSGTSLAVPVSCSSNLAGTYQGMTTATWCGDSDPWSFSVTFTEDAAGEYDIDDFSFGAFDVCYGGRTDYSSGSLPLGNLRMVDVCNNISLKGTSQWGEVFTWHSLTVNGTEMTIVWTNDYGEGGTAVLTNPNGWPSLGLAN